VVVIKLFEQFAGRAQRPVGILAAGNRAGHIFITLIGLSEGGFYTPFVRLLKPTSPWKTNRLAVSSQKMEKWCEPNRACRQYSSEETE